MYDLVEEFRQPVVDRTVLTFLSRHMATPEDFTLDDGGGCMIENTVKKKYASAILSRIHEKVSHEEATFQDIFSRQAQLLGKAITDGESYTPYRYR